MGKNKIITIPNIISLFRILLIPFIIVSYLDGRFWTAFGLIILSGFSDVLDGFLARHFNMVSDFGKILDPIADKLTQVAVVLMLLLDHLHLVAVWVLLIVLFIKELATLILATYLLNDGVKAVSARWWGKVATCSVYLTVILMVLNSAGINIISDLIISIAAFFSAFMLCVSTVGYFKTLLLPLITKKE